MHQGMEKTFFKSTVCGCVTSTVWFFKEAPLSGSCPWVIVVWRLRKIQVLILQECRETTKSVSYIFLFPTNSVTFTVLNAVSPLVLAGQILFSFSFPLVGREGHALPASGFPCTGGERHHADQTGTAQIIAACHQLCKHELDTFHPSFSLFIIKWIFIVTRVLH